MLFIETTLSQRSLLVKGAQPSHAVRDLPMQLKFLLSILMLTYVL